MAITTAPHIINFKRIGEPSIGYISVAQADSLPFEVKRIFWTYHTPESIVRGRHAHFSTEQILVAVSGRIIVTTENAEGEINTFVLEKPELGVYIPPNVWHTMQYSHFSVQMVLASSVYDEKDYIRSYEEFKDVYKTKQ
jgi:mannose-6-phosphate isomerase-like protein (cupin superfamily)